MIQSIVFTKRPLIITEIYLRLARVNSGKLVYPVSLNYYSHFQLKSFFHARITINSAITCCILFRPEVRNNSRPLCCNDKATSG